MKRLICVLAVLVSFFMFNAASSNKPETGAVLDIDGNLYKTVKIGNQWWMAENLKVTKNFKGHPMESFCYNNDQSYCEKYGRLYKWDVAMNVQDEDSEISTEDLLAEENKTAEEKLRGIAPEGWHIPSEADWDELVKTLGGEKEVAKMLRVGGPTGFEAHLSGNGDIMGNYLNLDQSVMYWSSTSPNDDQAYQVGFDKEGKWHKGLVYKDAKLHIRCVKNKN